MLQMTNAVVEMRPNKATVVLPIQSDSEGIDIAEFPCIKSTNCWEQTNVKGFCTYHWLVGQLGCMWGNYI